MSMPTAPFSGGAWPVRTVASVPVHGLYGPLLTMFGVDGNLGRVRPRSRWPKSAAANWQRCRAAAAVVPDSPLPQL